MKLPALLALLLSAGLSPAAVTVFHYRVNDTDEADLPTIPSVGGSPGTAQGTFSGVLSSTVPTVGVPAGAGNRSIVGAFDANSDGVNSAGIDELSISQVIANDGFSMEAWFLWNGGGTVNSIIDYAGTEKFRIHTGIAGNLDFNLDSGSGAQVIATSPTVGEWHYVAVTFDYDGLGVQPDGGIGGTLTWYFDGNTPLGSVTADMDDFGDSLNRPIGVGRHPSGFPGDDFDGLVYEPRVSLGALSASELLWVPEPGTAMLFALGLGVFLRRRR